MKKTKTYEKFVTSNKLKAEMNSRKKYSYDLQIYEDDFRFTLSIPPTGEIIQDNFDGLYKRKALYKSLETQDEIYNWLKEVHESILKEQHQEAAS